jgi:hypothetical protein
MYKLNKESQLVGSPYGSVVALFSGFVAALAIRANRRCTIFLENDSEEQIAYNACADRENSCL